MSRCEALWTTQACVIFQMHQIWSLHCDDVHLHSCAQIWFRHLRLLPKHCNGELVCLVGLRGLCDTGLLLDSYCA